MKASNPKRCFELGGKIRGLQDAINLPSASIHGMGRKHATERCIALYGEEKLKAMPLDMQKELFREHYPQKQLTAYLKLWVNELVTSVTVKQTISADQTNFVAERLYEMHSWKITDLTLFFRNVKEGLYGELYENLSAQKLLEWARTYLFDRAGVAEMLSEGNEKPFNGTTPVHPKVIEVMFKGVGESESPKALEVKEGTFSNSEKAFKAYLKNNAQAMASRQLIDVFYRWQQRNDLFVYTEIFIDVLKHRKEPGETGQMVQLCEALHVLKNKIPSQLTTENFSKIDEIQLKIITFIEQNNS